MPETVQYDDFDRVREAIAGTKGYQTKFSTIVSEPSSFLPTSTWTVETHRNEDRWIVLLQSISAKGSQRVVIPNKVAQAIYRQYNVIIKESKKLRAKAGAETRKAKLTVTRTFQNTSKED